MRGAGKRLQTIVRATALACLPFCTGCVKEQRDGETSVFTYETWVPLLLVLGGAVAVVAGIALWKRGKSVVWVLILGGLFVGLIIGPGLFAESVSVSPEQLNIRVGFWFSPTVHEVRFVDLQSAELTEEERRGRRGRKTKSYYLVCHLKSGGEQRVPVGTLMQEAGLKKTLEAMAAKDIPFQAAALP